MRHGKGSLRQGKLVINGEWENNKLNGYSLLKDNNF